MDFRQSNTAPASRPEASAGASSPQQRVVKKVALLEKSSGLFNILTVVILMGIAILLVLIIASFARSNTNAEQAHVDKAKYQAVFLNNGQVYFGSITELNSKYMRLNGIYYLTQSATTGANGQQQASGDYTLVKLGCQQIHYPTDQMVISRDQVTFWENLSKDGKVASKIEEFKKQNPNGPNCTETTDQTQSTPGASTQGSTAPSNTQTTTKKP